MDATGTGRAGPRRARWAKAAGILGFAGLGTALAVAAMEMAATASAVPYGLVPFVTSVVLVMTLPDSAPARPRAVIGGHVVSTLVGYGMLAAFGPSPWNAAAATGIAALLMMATRTLHPPAGIDPFLVVNDGLGPGFLLGIVLPGSLLLAGFARLWRAATAELARLSSSRSRSRAGTAEGRSTAPPRSGP